ncbi:hypothetical protein, partial [Hyphomonas sp.]|uniref:hypothetical protein n=1 Tax=Hyphomonas sp. TaxID=87 RepID=UPI0035650324
CGQYKAGTSQQGARGERSAPAFSYLEIWHQMVSWSERQQRFSQDCSTRPHRELKPESHDFFLAV